MARNPINPDIGQINCAITGEPSPVRKDKNGKLYYVSSAGMIKPNLQVGQEWMLENATIWGKAEPVNGDGPGAVPVNEEPPAADDDAPPPPHNKETPLTKAFGFLSDW